MFYVLEMTSPSVLEVHAWFQQLAPDSYFDQLLAAHQLRFRKRLYWPAVVVWLMIHQRLFGEGSLASTVQAFAQGGAFLWPRPAGDPRRPTIPVSGATGGYCQARQKLPTLIAEQVTDHLFTQLRARIQQNDARLQRPVFIVDGTTLRLQHETELVKAFPPGHNYWGENHWPILLLVAFHDAHTGLAARPSWGPMYGPDAASEQRLAAEALARLPLDAVVIGDGNFGIFAFAHAVQQSQRPVLLRLTASRAQKILGGLPPNQTHCRVQWRASRWELRAHPHLPAAANLEGWLSVCQNPSRPQEKLYLFTTLEVGPAEVLALYKLRWNIETDLRSLKRTVGLQQIHGRTVAMTEKQLLLAVAAYNLIRAIMLLAAQRAGLVPRQLSFAGVRAAILAALPGLDQAANSDEYRQRMDRLLHYAVQAKLPQRTRPRSYPREIWGRGARFPPRKPR